MIASRLSPTFPIHFAEPFVMAMEASSIFISSTAHPLYAW